MDIGNLLEFQGAFKGDGIIKGAAQEERVFTVAIVSGKTLMGST